MPLGTVFWYVIPRSVANTSTAKGHAYIYTLMTGTADFYPNNSVTYHGTVVLISTAVRIPELI
jgi:hypothetical protein